MSVGQESVPDRAAAAVLRYIADHRLTPGDDLPGELTLAQQLGLSRASLREALVRLRQTGVVSSARRRGMQLTRMLPFMPLASLVSGGADPETVQELCELRLMIEVGAATRLCARCTAADLAELDRMCGEEAAAIGDFDRLREIDRAFHQNLMTIAGNRQVSHLHGILLGFFDTATYHAAFDVWRKKGEPVRVDHRPLVAALASRDAARFAQSMDAHLAVHLAPRTTQPAESGPCASNISP